MKKRVLGVLLTAALVMSQAVCVFAASKETNVTVKDDQSAWYEVTGISEGDYTDVDEIYEAVQAVNDGEMSLKDLPSMSDEVWNKISGKSRVTNFFNLKPINGGNPSEDGTHTVTLSVPQLTDAMKGVTFLHYNSEAGTWELITPDDVDYEAKLLKISSKNLGILMVLADLDESMLDDGEGSGTSAKTGVTSNWAAYMCVAVVLMGAAVVVGKKRA